MARDLTPKCKRCRREGKKLFLKGARCNSIKCAMVKRKYAPGIHGANQKKRLTDYGMQLREKQQLKRTYRILERQFKKYFNKAKGQEGEMGLNLLRLLETRFDNILVRANIFLSRDQSRQSINHKHWTINQRGVNIPSYQVKVGDIIQLKENSSLRKSIDERINHEKTKKDIPGWLSVDLKKMNIKIVNLPITEDLPANVNTKLIVEFYSR